MLDTLRFVQGGVAKKDFVAALTHFRIRDHTIQGTNGVLTLCSPIAIDFDAMPKALPFVKAIQACNEAITMHLTPSGRLSIKSGGFKALIDCVSEGFPENEPEGERIDFPDGIIKALKTLYPFIGEDASRPWARGVMLRGGSAYATNNVVLAEYWIGDSLPLAINIPRGAITELLRIGIEPLYAKVTKNNATFIYADNQWLKTQLYSTEWPALARVFNRPSAPSPMPEGLWPAMESISPFINKLNQVYFTPGLIKTEGVDGSAGASIELQSIETTGLFNYHHFMLLKSVAKTIDLSSYPNPCMFFGENLRGAIIGMKT